MPLVPWWNMMQQPSTGTPDVNKMLTAQELALRLRTAQQNQQGYNAIGQLFANPSNLQNGMLRPDALAGAMGSGQVPAQIGLGVMGEQAKIAQDQMRSRSLQQADMQKERASVIDGVSVPAKAEYDRVLKATNSPEQAQAAAQVVFGERMDAISPTVSPETRRLMEQNRNYDDSRVTANIMGAAGIRQQLEKAQDFTTHVDYGRTPPVEYRQYKGGRITDITGASPYTPTGVGETKGPEATVYVGQYDDGQGGKREVRFRYGPTGPVDDSNQPLDPSKITGASKIGTKAQQGGEVKVLGDTTKAGDEYLGSLPVGERNVVSLMVQGKSPPVSAFAMKSPDMQRMLAEAKQADPSFDQTTWGKRYGVMRSYSSGKDHTDLVSFNTAINHAGALWHSAQQLGNFGGFLTPLNPLKETLQTRTGDPRYTTFNQNATALSEELERAFRGTGGNVESIREWRKSLNEAGSPAQIQGAIEKAMELLAGRIGAKRDDFDRSMGPSANFSQFISPTSRRAIATLPGGEAIAQVAGPGAETPATPAATAPVGSPAAASAAIPPAAAATHGAPVPDVGGVPTYSTKEQFDAHPPTGPWRRADDPPGKVRMP